MSITDEQLVAMLDAFGHAWHRWEQSDSNAEMWERGRARDEERRAIVDAYAELRTELADANTMIGSLGSQLAAVKAERDKLRGIAQALRITVAEMLSGKQHTPARTMVWRSTLKYAAEALSADAPSEPEPRRQCDSRLLDPEQPLMLWRCVADAGHDGEHWSRHRLHEWEDDEAYDINAAEPTAAEQEQRPYRVWRGACPPVHSDQRWQWACELCDARLCHGGTEAQNRVDAEQHIATQHAEQGGE